MTASPKRRRAYWLEVGRDLRNVYQFGQTHDAKWDGGSAACGPTDVQFLAKGWHPGRPIPTLDRIAELMGRTPQQVRDGAGSSPEQMLTALRKLDVPYTDDGAWDAMELLEIAKHRGPVLFLCTYGVWPDWSGYNYFGTKADGRPNGFARPLEHAGRTQLDGFDDGRHYGILLTSRWFPARKASDAYLRDPNHNSGSRPEKPPFDIVTADQWVWLFRSGQITGDRWAAIPKEAWNG